MSHGDHIENFVHEAEAISVCWHLPGLAWIVVMELETLKSDFWFKP